ncbi:MAG: hypothetical protein GY765_29475 [bacterium]|nr:hypothetical protein [bacterium]
MAIDFNNLEMQYPLPERIGEPDLFTGRRKEFEEYQGWINGIPKKLSRSRVILARRKCGKTAFVQRIFNRLWSAGGEVIPFYFEIKDQKVWLGDFAEEYFRTFVSHYISFLERSPDILRKPFEIEQIKEYGQKNSIQAMVDDVAALQKHRKDQRPGMMWEVGYNAPHRYAALYKKFFLVIIDEFQNINGYIYRDKACETALDETITGSFHEHSESKIAPMLCTGSDVGWLLHNVARYLGVGRFKQMRMKTYLTDEEGLEAVYKYATIYGIPITNETAILINRLCYSDAFFISCIIRSSYESKDLVSAAGVIDTINYELTSRDADFGNNWEEYFRATFSRVNEVNAKKMLLHLTKYRDRSWTPEEIKEALHLDMEVNEVQEKLEMLRKADLIGDLSSIDYIGADDGTFYMVLRHRFEKEISGFRPDFKKEFQQEIEKLKRENRSLRGRLSQLVGRMAEDQLALDFRTRARFSLSVYFVGVKDETELNIHNVTTRFYIQRADGRNLEIDIAADSQCGRAVLVEVKKTQAKTNKKQVEDFQEKIEVYGKQNPDRNVLPAFLSLGGFTEGALQYCKEKEIATADKLNYFQAEWSK